MQPCTVNANIRGAYGFQISSFPPPPAHPKPLGTDAPACCPDVGGSSLGSGGKKRLGAPGPAPVGHQPSPARLRLASKSLTCNGWDWKHGAALAASGREALSPSPRVDAVASGERPVSQGRSGSSLEGHVSKETIKPKSYKDAFGKTCCWLRAWQVPASHLHPG